MHDDSRGLQFDPDLPARPFSGQTSHEILAALLRSDYRLPGDSHERRALDAVVQRCLAKDPGDRYGSAAELATQLIPALARCGGIDGHPEFPAHDAPTLGDHS